MLTDNQIQELIAIPKSITLKEPASGYEETKTQRRCKLNAVTVSDESEKFEVFIRRHIRYIENFTIGLRYQTGDASLGAITLVRYNGSHGEISRDPDGHFAVPHIHRITHAELVSGSREPQETQRELTVPYTTYEQALIVFFSDTGIENYHRHFPEAVQLKLLDGC